MDGPLPSPDADTFAWPEGFASSRRPRTPAAALIQGVRSLTADDVEATARHVESGASLGVKTPNLRAIRHTHHRLAQLLAAGMDEVQAARLCNYGVGRVSILKNDPSFRELLAYYATNVAEEFTDFIRTAADLSMDMLSRLQEQLDEEPEKFTPDVLLRAISTLADRSGNAPTQKNINVNVNTDVAARLRAAESRLRTITPADAAE